MSTKPLVPISMQQQDTENNKKEIIPYVLNPITKKMMKRDSPTIQKFIASKVIDEEGNVLITKEEIEEMINSAQAKLLIRQNRIFDGVEKSIHNIPLHEVFLMMELCQQEIKSPTRDKDFEELKKRASKFGDDVKKIADLRE